MYIKNQNAFIQILVNLFSTGHDTMSYFVSGTTREMSVLSLFGGDPGMNLLGLAPGRETLGWLLNCINIVILDLQFWPFLVEELIMDKEAYIFGYI